MALTPRAVCAAACGGSGARLARLAVNQRAALTPTLPLSFLAPRVPFCRLLLALIATPSHAAAATQPSTIAASSYKQQQRQQHPSPHHRGSLALDASAAETAAMGCTPRTCDAGCCFGAPASCLSPPLRPLSLVVFASRAVLRSLAAADCSAHVLHMNLKTLFEK